MAEKASKNWSADAFEACDERQWFIVQCKPGCEGRVEGALWDREIVCYLPKEKLWTRRRGCKLLVERPLLPGYLFVYLPGAEPDFASVSAIDGFAGFVRRGARAPLPIPNLEVRKLLIDELDGVYDHTQPSKVKRRYAPGDAVKIIRGKFSGFLATVKEPAEGDDADDVRVEFHVTRNARPCELSLDAEALADATPA